MRSVLRFMVALFAAQCLLACENVEPPPHERPNGVPASATFIGGVDGGAFVEIAKVRDDYSLTVYLDSGAVAYRGHAVLQPADPSRKVTLSDVTSWDGKQLLLVDGAALVPTGSIKPIE